MMKNRLLLSLLVGATFSALSMEVQVVAFGSATDQGKRPNQEDRFVANKSCIAVFDGSAGADLADKAVALLQDLQQKEDDSWESVNKVFSEAQLFARSNFSSSEKRQVGSFLYSKSQCLTTANIVHINSQGLLNIGWVGDTRAIVINKLGKVVAATVDHKPDREDERKRLEEAYEGVYIPAAGRTGVARVCNDNGPAISRCIGCLYWEDEGVTMEPEYLQKPIQEDDLCVVVACDGVWDVLSNEDVAKFVKDFMETHEVGQMSSEACNKLCQDLLVKALSNPKCTDNVTAAAMFFGEAAAQREEKQEKSVNLTETKQKQKESVSIWARWGNKIVCIGGPLAILLMGWLLYKR